MARVPKSIRAARKHAQNRHSRASMHSMASKNHPRGCTWRGVRERVRGRWAAEIHVPGTHSMMCIGSFEQAVQAALAYDAALFCFYGARHLPSLLTFNFPTAPHPDIREDVRATLTPTNIKNIAESHARTLARFFVGPLPATNPAVASPPTPATVTDGTAIVSSEPAPTTTDGCNGNCMS